MRFTERFLPPTQWQRIKYLLWYKWISKYRWRKVRKSLINGTFWPKIKNNNYGMPIDDIVLEQQMTHITDTELDWEWIDDKDI